MSEPPPQSRAESQRRLGRRAGLVVFSLLVGGFTAVCSAQIIQQVWFPETTSFASDCRTGIHSLLTAVQRARRGAAAETGDERAALARFRRELDPEWTHRAALEALCRSDAENERALRELVQLRYAEEHAVRYEAVDLARLRRRVYALDPGLQEANPR